jgi:hypothetical protein
VGAKVNQFDRLFAAQRVSLLLRSGLSAIPSYRRATLRMIDFEANPIIR